MSEIDIKVLRNNLRGYRVRAGLTQKDVAKALNVTIATFNRWEQHPEKIDFDKFVKIANLYNVPINDFFMNM